MTSKKPTKGKKAKGTDVSLPNTKNVGGRPKAIDSEKLMLLDTMFAVGATDVQACVVAGINPETLYAYQRKNPEYTERKSMLKGMLDVQAKAVIFDTMKNGNKKDRLETAKYVMNNTEYKREGEGGPGTQINIQQNVNPRNKTDAELLQIANAAKSND